MLTLSIEIPALDRLCAILEQRDKAGIVAEIEHEIVAKLKEAAEGGAPRPRFEEVPPADDHPWKGEAAKPPTPACEQCADYVTAREEAAPEGRKGAQEPPKAEPAGKPTEAAQAATAGKPVTLADVQRAAAQMRDDGKLKAVTDMFPEFGIKKLSDLKGDALQGFAARLRGMGAAI